MGVFHWILRHRFLTISFHPETALSKGWSIRWWDFLFYLSFGIVITFSVPIAGVLLVFSFLVVPAAIAFQFTRRQGALAAISWMAGALASAGGLWVSFHYDLPTGPVVVCMFGFLLLVAYALRRALGGRADAVLAPLGGNSAV
jgi:zinc/manganese transport system permease protein